MEHTTGTVTVQQLESKTGTPYKNPGDVVFDVAYADGYPGPRLMPEGRVTISRESAEDFEARGIGHIVVEAEAPVEQEATTETQTPPPPKKKGRQ